MPKPAVAAHRARQRRQGLIRVEVSVHREDAALLRGVAAALSDPARRDHTRRLLAPQFSSPPPVSLKQLLASAPLDGIDLRRDKSPGRDVDL